MPLVSQPASASIEKPDYWWYAARAGLLAAAVGEYVGDPARTLDVGSADGPSVDWLPPRTSLDLDPAGLMPGGVCGSALALPFADGAFDLVTAFDVVEHCEPESVALAEVRRVLAPGGRFLLSVPAYQWAWTDFDVAAGHYRRYTRRRLRDALAEAEFTVDRCTHIFAGTLPPFTAERLVRRLRPTAEASLPKVSPAADRVLRGLCRLDAWWLHRRDLSFGSSVVAAATKPA
ncbi:class I SAM-dependent methyltransferase [Angustibacter sp. McL0619]|uniref:class I SAM-dependent methyltransferase n=1 Tax=Angustibacter sp. McL0619 TaxID=3415676 RepID=UPI003CEA6DD2